MIEILLVAADPALRGFVVELLGQHAVTVVYTPKEAAGLLRDRRYGLVIITNFGVSPRQVVSIIPRQRDYPVFFLSGFMDEALRRMCDEKHIHYRTMPIEIPTLLRELRIALDDAHL